jgi:hypothetical protein
MIVFVYSSFLKLDEGSKPQKLLRFWNLKGYCR